MADSDKRRREPVRETVRETTKRGEKRRNPRFPNSSIWSDEQRRQHREERDSVLEDAGLVTDRMIGPDGEPIDADAGPDAGKAQGD